MPQHLEVSLFWLSKSLNQTMHFNSYASLNIRCLHPDFSSPPLSPICTLISAAISLIAASSLHCLKHFLSCA